MAGSLKWFEYITDGGEAFALFMDESNGEAIGNVDYTAASSAQFKLPSNVTARFARYTSADGNYQRVIPISSTAIAAALPATIDLEVAGQAGLVTMSLSIVKGEVFSPIPRAADTGLNDGDDT